MKCPHCNNNVSLFSKSINRFKNKTCPHCNKTVELSARKKVILFWFIPALLLHSFMLKPALAMLNVSSGVSAALTGLMLLLASYELTQKND